jgi:hypothetical protein
MDIISNLFSSDFAVPAIIVGIILVVIVLFVVAKLFLPDGSTALKEELRSQARITMSKANKMLQDGYLPQAVIEAHKAIEMAMRGLLKDKNITSFDAIKVLQKRGALSSQNVDRAHNLRIQRNKMAHGSAGVNAQLARIYVSDANSILSQLLS